jgi:hypothetical protein
LWIIFEPINSIKINRAEKYFALASQNPIKRVFVNEKKYTFSEIKRFIMTEDFKIIQETKYLISAVLKDDTQILFSQSLNEKTASRIASHLNYILKS